MKRYIFRHLRDDESGNFGVLTVILVPVLLLLCSIALNLVNAMNAKNQLQAASDAAALAISAAYNAGTTTQQALDRIAAQYLNANIRSSGIDPQSVVLKVSISGGPQKQASVAVSGKLDTFMPNVLGRAKMDISVKTLTSIGTKAYYQIAFLIDVSGSMAIGATDYDIMKLKSIKEINCEFACHDPGGAFDNDKAAIAKVAGIKLKFDYVQSALGIFVDKLKLVATVNPGSYNVGVFTLGTDFKTHLPMTSNMADFEKSATSVYLEKAIPYSCKTHFGYTSLAGGLTGVLSKLKNIGDGSSALKRNTYVILITDGVQEEIKGCKEVYTDYYRKECLKLKNAGVKIVTIQTGYPEVKHELYYEKIKPLLPRVTKTLQFCATDAESYLHADDGPAIENAIKIAFKSIFSDTFIKG